MAEIYDVLVTIVDLSIDEQDLLTISEFKRAIGFSRDAVNQTEASKLREKAIELGLSLSEIYDLDNIEEDDSEENTEKFNFSMRHIVTHDQLIIIAIIKGDYYEYLLSHTVRICS